MVSGGSSTSLSAPTSPQNHAQELTTKRRSRHGARSCPTSPTAAMKATSANARKSRRAPPSPPSSSEASFVDQPSSSDPLSRRKPAPRGKGGSGTGGSSQQQEQQSTPTTERTKVAAEAPLHYYPFTAPPTPADHGEGGGGLEIPSAQMAALSFLPPGAAPPPPKRLRARHDVDGPGTGDLPCKKRRLRRTLITSRLSQPYSLPATHILNRESSSGEDDALSRFLRRLGAVKKASHQAGLVRRAAILNRVRIRVRQAAVQRGHTQIADLAARQNVLNHGLLVVTAPDRATGGRFFPSPPGMVGGPGVPNAWRPHTTTAAAAAAAAAVAGAANSHTPTSSSSSQLLRPPPPPPAPPPASPRAPLPPSLLPSPALLAGEKKASGIPLSSRPELPVPAQMAPTLAHTTASPSGQQQRQEPQQRAQRQQQQERPAAAVPAPAPAPAPPRNSICAPVPGDSGGEEDNNMAFPAPDLDTRYADLSDDDMDDVYADFGVLFGGGSPSSSAEDRAGGAGASAGGGDRAAPPEEEEHFYEEYLDELDGIPWIT